MALEQVSPEVVLPMVEAVRHLDACHVDEAVAADVRFGKVLERTTLGAEGDGPWAVVAPEDQLLAVYEPFRGTTAKPAVVLVG